MYSSDNNNLHDDTILADELLNVIRALNDNELYDFFKQMDYSEKEKLGWELLDAVRNNDISKVLKLIKAGADINVQSEYTDTALMIAIRLSHVKIAEELIKAGTNVNIYNKIGNTALIEATRGNNLLLIKKLINAGAKINHQNNFYHRALYYAKNTIISKYLISLGAED